MDDWLPAYLVEAEVWTNLLPVPVAAFALAALLALVVNSGDAKYSQRFLPLSAFALLGFAIGMMTGLSREPAVSATVGATLTLVGGTLAYLLGTKGAEGQNFTSVAVGLLVFCLFFGTNWGSILRRDAEFYPHTADYRIKLEEENFRLRMIRVYEHLPDPDAKANPESGAMPPPK